MSEAINCNYARTVIRTLCQREFVQSGNRKQRLPKESLENVVEEYNARFSEVPAMQISLAVARKRIYTILATFNRKWHPESQKKTFLNIFSLTSWAHLTQEEKNKHSLRKCSACRTQHVSLTRAFPAKSQNRLQNKPMITFNEQDLSSPSNFGKKSLKQLNAISEEHFRQPIQDVIVETPRSRLILKPSSQEKQTAMRRSVRSAKKAIQQAMDENSMATVMSNRISWRKFDQIRKSETLEDHPQTPTRKRKSNSSDETTPPSKRKHGTPINLSKAAEEGLLTEARSWDEDYNVNWSDLARRQGITEANGGQSIKEFLKGHGIPAALKDQQAGRSLRRKRRTLPGGVPFPMHRHSSVFKEELSKQVQSGDVIEGTPVVPTSVTSFSYNSTENEVIETSSTVFARKIPLLDIRKKLLEKHEKLGIIRYRSQSLEDDALEGIESRRYLKIWHDHSSIAGHGHFLVLISVIYDSAFYLTQEEVNLRLGKEIDIQSTVETPELHILGRSSSSIDDQSLFSTCRNECLSTLTTPLFLSSGVQVTDTLRFFHGDGPAQQFEAGNSIGGNYCCVGCGVRSDRIDDIAYAFRCKQLSLHLRQEILLQGVAWKNISSRSLDNLLLADLKKELSMRGISVEGKKKPALAKEFDDIKLGATNFPALLQNSPKATLSSLNIQHYEVSPTEPLHDLKGHLGNIIDETLVITTGDVLQEIKKIKAVVLTKEAIRCSDLRKAVILIYLKLKTLQPNSMLTSLYCSAVEITNLCYAHDNRRTPKSVLCLYNRTFLHVYQCSILFSDPKSTTRRRMFGRYFHSIGAHAAELFRIVSLRSLNTEQHERMFQQAKSITKGTSNNHPQHIISNIVQRLHFEQGTAESVIASQESQIKALSAKVGPMENTIISHSVMREGSVHYQAHLERISDYLVLGPGVWWKKVSQGVMFLDGTSEEDFRDVGPSLQHFRSTSLTDIKPYLHQKWEACCSDGVELPATSVRYYGQDGILESISMQDPDNADSSTTLEIQEVQMTTETALNDEDPVSVPVLEVIPDTNPIQEDDTTAQSVTHTNYKTSLAENLFTVLQDSRELREFDKLRFYLKNSNSPRKSLINRYRRLSQQFQMKVFKKYNTSQQHKTQNICKKLLVNEWKYQL